MADEIQGLAVKASITDDLFTQGVSKINKAMSLLQSEFKASSEGLKGFGTNVDQLGNKSEYLNKAIELQQQKVKALQEAYAKSKTETGEFSNSTMAAGTKVNNAVAQLAKLQNELKAVDKSLEEEKKKVDDEGSVWEKFSNKLKSATDGMGEYIKRGIGLAIGGDIWDKAKEGFTSIISFGGDAQVALNGITASTGLTQDGMSQMRQVMTDIYNDNFGENFEDIAESITMVGQQTGETGDDLKELTEKALLMRDTFGFEVNDSIKAVNSMIKEFGVSGDQAFNLIAQGAQQGLNKNGDLLDVVGEYSVQFAKVGLNADDMFNSIKAGADSGAFSVDILSDGLKEFAIRAIDGSKTTQDGFTQLGLNVNEMAKKFAQGGDTAKGAFQQVVTALSNMNDPLLQNQVGVDLFGTKWEDLGSKAITALANTNGSISQTTDALGSINNVKYDDLGKAFEGIKRNVETALLLPVSNEILPSLNEFSSWFLSNLPDIKEQFSQFTQVFLDIGASIGDAVKPILEDLFNFITEHGEATKNIILGIGGAFLAFKTVKGTIDGITNAMKLWDDAMKIKESIAGIVEVMKGWEIATKLQTIAQGALNVVMDANPIAIIVIAIGALVAGIVLAYNKFEWFRNGVNAVGEWLKNFFTVTLPEAFNNIINWSKELPAKAAALWAMIKTTFSNGWNSIANFFTTTIPIWINNIVQWFTSLPSKIMYGLGELVGMLATWGVNVWNYFSTNVPIWINNVTIFFSQLPTNIWNFLMDIVAKLGEWGSNVLTYITTNVPIWINNIVTFFSQLPGQIWTWLVNIVTDLGTWGNNIISWISTNVPQWIANIVTFFSQLPANIWTWLVNVVTDISTWGSNMYSTTQTEVSNVTNGIIQWFEELPSKMLDIGKNIVDGIRQGISNAWDDMKGWVGGLCDNFVQGVKDKFEIHSPSHIFRDEIGKMLAQGIGVGFEQEMPTINTNIGKTIDGTIQIANLSSLSSLKNLDRTYTSNSNSSNQSVILYTTNINQLDGKEISRTTTKQVLNNLTRETKNNNRSLGRSNLAYV